MTEELSELEKAVHGYSGQKYFPLKDKLASAIGQQVLIVEANPARGHLFHDHSNYHTVLGILKGQITPSKDKKHSWEDNVIKIPFEHHTIRGRDDWELVKGPYAIAAHEFSRLDDADSYSTPKGCFGSEIKHQPTLRIIAGNEPVQMYFKMRHGMAMMVMKSLMTEEELQKAKKYAYEPSADYARALKTLGLDAPEDCSAALLTGLDEELIKILKEKAKHSLGIKVENPTSEKYISQVVGQILKYDDRGDDDLDVLGFNMKKSDVLRQLKGNPEFKEGSD